MKLFLFKILLFINLYSSNVLGKDFITNGEKIYDTNGEVVNAHGGGFIKVNDYYYWIGENRKNGVFVSCYRSKDLTNWEFRGDLLTLKSSSLLKFANIERPKVIYNDSTKQFVMWMHYEENGNYYAAKAAVAYSDDIEKPFTYIGSFRPFNNMSRDCTLFKDDDGTAYFISSARENYDLIFYKLSDNYLTVKQQIANPWAGAQREAPAVIKRGDYYFIITSGCTGWAPNQAKYAYAKQLEGPWSQWVDLGDKTTYDSQSTYILSVETKDTNSYIYVGDRWDANNYFNSTFVFLPLNFPTEKSLELKWNELLLKK